MLILLYLSVLVELMLYRNKWLWKNRVYVVLLLVVLIGMGSTLVILEEFNPLTAMTVFLSIWRFFNVLRILKSRLAPEELRWKTRKSGLSFMAAQVALLLMLQLQFVPDFTWFWTSLVWIQPVAAASIFVVTVRNIQKTKQRPSEAHYSDKELPTLTVAIAARNETADLENCIQSILTNDYPKLEVLVLDDCSQDRTSEIIKSFAHAGVRFVQGEEVDERWLAKNYAYQRLLEEATGEYILYCGVDVRFGPQAIRQLLTDLINRQKTMMSVLPRRAKSASNVASALIQPMRYWWELAWPRRLFNRPPVLSTCWVIKRKTLSGMGGFNGTSRAIVPEAYIARELVNTDGYSFVRASQDHAIETVKQAGEQRATAFRVRYPQLKRKPELVLFVTGFEVLLLIGPFALLIAHIFGASLPLIPVFTSCILLVLTHVLIVGISDPRNILTAFVSYPFAIIAEIGLTYVSMYQYEFSDVIWKGRNICLPVLRAIPRLPDASIKQ